MVCKFVDDTRDAAAFELAHARHGSFNNMRTLYTQHLRMKKGAWDEGWGWSKPVSNRPFGKMLAAAYMLERGIGAFPESTNPLWTRDAVLGPPQQVGPQSLLDPICALKIRQPVMVADDGRDMTIEMSHALVTSATRRLMHYYEDAAFQMLQTDATAAAGGPSIVRICALADEALAEPGTEAWCYGASSRPAVIGAIDRNALIWVFGRSIAGEVAVYTMDWYAAQPQWRALDLSTVLRTANPANLAGIDEVPAVLKQGTPDAHRIDVVVRNGFTLYHMWHEGSNGAALSGWQAQDVSGQFGAPALAQQLEIRTRPTIAAHADGSGFHVFARSQNGALMQYTYVFDTAIRCGTLPFPTVLPCRVPVTGGWVAVRNVDNEVDERPLADLTARANVAGPISAVTAHNGAIHVFQHKTDGRAGLYHYVFENNIWRRGEWWGASAAEPLNGPPCIVVNDQRGLRQDDFPFDLYVAGSAGTLYGFQHLQGYDDWLRDNLTQAPLISGAGGGVPVVRPGIAASLIRFEEWIVRNVVVRPNPGSDIVRYTWVNRAGWAFDGLPSAGWRVETVPNSSGSFAATAAINDFERLLDVYTFTADELVRYRLTRDRPWHTSADYYNWASGETYDFDYQPEDSDDSSPAYAEGYWEVFMRCRSFDQSAGPARRASYMVHEATHVNEHYRGTFSPWTHDDVNGEDMDDWFVHFLWEIASGSLDPAEHKHSMYQIGIEFLADLGEFPAAELPLNVWQNALSDARGYMSARIRNIPPWTPGVPRPL